MLLSGLTCKDLLLEFSTRRLKSQICNRCLFCFLRFGSSSACEYEVCIKPHVVTYSLTTEPRKVMCFTSQRNAKVSAVRHYQISKSVFLLTFTFIASSSEQSLYKKVSYNSAAVETVTILQMKNKIHDLNRDLMCDLLCAVWVKYRSVGAKESKGK